MEWYTPQKLESSPPEEILKQLFSFKSYITYALKDRRLYDGKFKQIGKGQCGAVYGMEDKVIKIPNSFKKLDELCHEAQTHERVLEAFDQSGTDIWIPNFHAWADEASPFWSENGSYFTGTMMKYGIISDRINPLPLPVRKAVVHTFCPRSLQGVDYINNPENDDCLVRLYLGRRNVPKAENVSLRNFPLHVDDMERLGLDIKAYAETMGKSLAIMHWAAGTDANDIEFVLGLVPHSRGCMVGIWLLDFNQCSDIRNISDPKSVLKRLVDGYQWNDPYYPRPNLENANDEQLWTVFSQAYLDESARYTKTDMPNRFVEALENQQKTSVGGLFG